MASPVGHIMVGASAAAAVAGITDTPFTASLWCGAVAGSLLPDGDLALRAFGMAGPRFHRNGSHSLLVLGLLAAGGFTLAWWVGSDARVVAAWSAALLSHPVLDVLSTGRETGRQGYGIALLWPVHRRRWWVDRPILGSLDLSTCRSISDVWLGVRPEIIRLGPATAIVVGASLVF